MCVYQATRLREYQGVDPHFDDIARQYQDIVKVTIIYQICTSFAPNVIDNVNQLCLETLFEMTKLMK